MKAIYERLLQLFSDMEFKKQYNNKTFLPESGPPGFISVSHAGIPQTINSISFRIFKDLLQRFLQGRFGDSSRDSSGNSLEVHPINCYRNYFRSSSKNCTRFFGELIQKSLDEFQKKIKQSDGGTLRRIFERNREGKPD